MKKLILIALTAFILISITGCDAWFYGSKYAIYKQENTEWISEDGNIVINSDNVIIFSDNEEHVYECGYRYNGIYVYELDDNGVQSEVESWTAHYYPNEFTVTVYESRYFERMTKIKFYKVM